MKKLFLIFALALATFAMQAQLLTKQIAFGAKGIDSISGAVSATYYYLNTGALAINSGTTITAAIGTASHVASTQPITNYRVAVLQAMYTHPLVYTASDSAHFTWEISLDNVHWVKLTNAGATTPATQTTWLNGGPRVTGAAFYLYTDDLIATTSADAGAIWIPNTLHTPYIRLAVQRYKATSAGYITAWVTLATTK